MAFPFVIRCVTPGKYWIKVVWDNAKPRCNKFRDKMCLPLKGDYESLRSPVIAVKAGEVIRGIEVLCNRRVTGPVDLT